MSQSERRGSAPDLSNAPGLSQAGASRAGASQAGGSVAGQIGASLDTQVARIVVDTGLVLPQEIDFCREQQKQSSDPNQRSLADLLIENNFITATQARRIKSQLQDSE